MQRAEAGAAHAAARQLRRAFLGRHAEEMCAELTDGLTRELRLDELCAAATRWTGPQAFAEGRDPRWYGR